MIVWATTPDIRLMKIVMPAKTCSFICTWEILSFMPCASALSEVKTIYPAD
jgi:hypothetical protein